MTPTLSPPAPQRHVFLQPEDGVFELSGSPTAWIWVCTCPTPMCHCRTAVVLATHDGRAALLERIAPVYDVWSRQGGLYRAAATAIDKLVSFEIDIDDGEVYGLTTGDRYPLELQEHPAIAALAGRIQGRLLDSIDMLWHHGKGFPGPDDEPLQYDPAMEADLPPGAMLTWTEVCDARSDVYVLEGRRFERFDLYCPKPNCHCDEVVVAFQELDTDDSTDPGTVLVTLSGTVKLRPHHQGDPRLAQLWAAFRQRYPDYLALFAERNARMKELGATFVHAPLRVAAKPGRNEPCPCGSGKKYKKCCGAN